MGWLRSRYIQTGVLVALIIGGILFYNIYTFKLSSTSPSNNQEGAPIDQQITLTFSKQLADSKDTRVNINNQQVEDFKIEEQTLTINFPLLPYTEYQVLVSEIQSTSGKRIEQVALSFVTGDLPAQAKQTKQSFLTSLPVFFEDFSVDYTVATSVVNVEILKGPVEQTKKKALDYLAQYYITEATDTITFFVIPSISGQSGP